MKQYYLTDLNTQLLKIFRTFDELETFHERYRLLPVVTLERSPGLLIDSYESMCKVIVHLIEVYGYRRLAFICPRCRQRCRWSSQQDHWPLTA